MSEGRRYATAVAFRRAADDRLKERAKDRQLPVDRVRREWVLQCYLARVFTLPDSQWLLKGGTGLLMRFPGARHTKDLDLCHPTIARVDDGIDELIAAGAASQRDPFVFDITRREALTGNAEGIRLTVKCRLGPKVFETFPIDLSTRLDFVGAIEHREVAMEIDIDDIAAPPPLRLYPLVDQIADKLAAMYEKHGERGSSRYRDLVDLIIITTSIDGDEISTADLEAALAREEHRRTGLTLPATMVPPGSDWAAGYRKTAIQAQVQPADLDEALAVVGAMINPVLGNLPR